MGRCSCTTTCSASPRGTCRRFVKRYANLSREIRDALEAYAADVRSGTFPSAEFSYAMDDDELAAFDADEHARSVRCPLSAGGLRDATENARRLGQRRRAEIAGNAELRERRAEVEALAVPAAELGERVPWAAVSIPSATTSSPSDDASRTIASMKTRSTWPLGRPATNGCAIFNESSGNSRRCASDEWPVPKSSSASETPSS